MALTGTFIYPPSGQDLNFSANDTIQVTWESYASNATACILSTWVWSDGTTWTESKLSYSSSEMSMWSVGLESIA